MPFNQILQNWIPFYNGTVLQNDYNNNDNTLIVWLQVKKNLDWPATSDVVHFLH